MGPEDALDVLYRLRDRWRAREDPRARVVATAVERLIAEYEEKRHPPDCDQATETPAGWPAP